MLVKLPDPVNGLRSGADALTAAYRARLRARTYATASLNTAPSPEIVPVTTADGARLRVHAYGPADGDVIVLIHGWSCCIEYWNPQINTFAGEYRVVAYDQRGHGESGVGTRPFGPDQLADDLSDILDAVLRPGQRAVLVGHSMGGMTIQAWAQQYPEQVEQWASAVVLATTAARQIPARAKVVPLVSDVVAMPVWAAQAVFGTPVPLPGSAAVRTVFKSRIMNRASDADQAAFGLAIVRSCRPAVRAAVARDLAKLDLGTAAAAITVPTSVIAGEFDKLLPEIHSREIADVLAESGSLDRYTILPTGHLPNIEAPQEFNAELHRMVRIGRHGSRAVAS
ncbi:alpha/beta fold hydrolase [Nocardia mexicana]|uniref:Pimeloyl-ACP methyl ester carboxylesterase n=1 Tax=Nocardia mexicana TaxID=279262 RepID=A0A370H6M3_9NOCA|nr:alpha/beta hydrolase [Nocardia mexicana]RDI52060.1 pimeloyl-ACP methyl ester carboxylesterase [Nocardia mexicana]